MRVTIKTFSVGWRLRRPGQPDLLGWSRVHAVTPLEACRLLLGAARAQGSHEGHELGEGTIRAIGVTDGHGLRRDFHGMGEL